MFLLATNYIKQQTLHRQFIALILNNCILIVLLSVTSYVYHYIERYFVCHLYSVNNCYHCLFKLHPITILLDNKNAFKDANRVNKTRTLKKDRQYSVQKKDKQFSTKQFIKTKNWATWIPLKIIYFACLRPVSCVPNVNSVSRLSILDFPFGFYKRLFKIKHHITHNSLQLYT